MKTGDFKKKRFSEKVDQKKLIAELRKGSLDIYEIADKFNIPIKNVKNALAELSHNKAMINEVDGTYSINDEPLQGGKHELDISMWQGDVLKFGLVSDNHLCSKFERLDVLNALYDIFQDEGISVVLNGGNWIDGEARFNKNEIHTKGFDKQMEYAVNNYPFREGMETWFVSGDDHEGWYNQREGINSGEYWQMKRERAGMFDLKHMGYVEADISLTEGKFDRENYLRLAHAGGGSAYAVSYAPQKIIESYQGGEKPAVAVFGHYHKISYNYIRGVHVIQPGCTQDQTIFMRKRKLEAHVGGCVIELRRAKDGVINRCKTDFITFFDRGFYLGNDKYWQ